MYNMIKVKRTNMWSYQCAFLCIGQLGGDEVLNGGQQHNDQCTNESAGPQQVIQQDHAHNDLNGDENVSSLSVKVMAQLQCRLCPSD